MRQYQQFDTYDGTLGGRTPFPAGPNDVASPGGLATIQHHWTGGMFGKNERTYDAYAGTGDRYVRGEYGNMYVPNSHASLYDHYGGPQTDATDYQTLTGDPYYWMNDTTPPIPSFHTGGMNSPVPSTRGGAGRENFINGVLDSNSASEKNFDLISPAAVPQDGGRLPHSYSSPGSSKNNSNPGGSMFNPRDYNEKKSLPKRNSPASVTPKALKGSATPAGSSIDDSTSREHNKFCFSFGDKNKKLTLVAMVFVLLMAAITFDFWTETIHRFIKQYVSRGLEIKWTRYAMFSSVATVFLFVTTYLLGAQQEFSG